MEQCGKLIQKKKKKKSQDIVDLGEIVHLLRDILTSIFENN